MIIAMVALDGWARLFSSAFSGSRNGMLLVDERREVVDVNVAYLSLVGARRDAVVGHPLWEQVAGEPLATPDEWRDALAAGRFNGQAELRCTGGETVAVQWGASAELVTGRRLVLFVTVGASRWGVHLRRGAPEGARREALTPRELEIVRLVSLGLTSREIAGELHVSHETVRTHIRNAMTKLHARSRAHLVAKAMTGELFSSPDL
jgi:PAS domain S-box-containing protein